MNDPNTEKVRALVAEGVCPFCNEGPFNSIANHTYMAHEVTAFELRELAGLPRTAVLTSPDYHERRSVRSKEFADANPEVVEAALEKGRAASVINGRASAWERPEARERFLADRRRPERIEVFQEAIKELDRSEIARKRSPEAVAAQTERIHRAHDKWADRVGEEAVKSHMARIGGLVRPESRVKAGKAGSAAVRAKFEADPDAKDRWRKKIATTVAQQGRVKVHRSEYDEIKQRSANGETNASIAESYGCSRSLISQIVRGLKD